MCILAILVGNSNSNTILCSNRDEIIARPTERGHIRPENLIFSAIDLDAGGTWLALEGKFGRFAVVLNYHTWRYSNSSPTSANVEYLSRGKLVSNFLESKKEVTAESYAHSVTQTQSSYRGFSLVVGDPHGCYYVSTAAPETCQPLTPGELYVVSNGSMDPWEKVGRLRASVEQVLVERGELELKTDPLCRQKRERERERETGEARLQRTRALSYSLLSCLLDGTPLRDATHGDSCPVHSRLSAVFVPPTTRSDGNLFGTRASTVVVIERRLGEGQGEREGGVCSVAERAMKDGVSVQDHSSSSSSSSSSSWAFILERDKEEHTERWSTNEFLLPFL